jgi:lysozyme family protein
MASGNFRRCLEHVLIHEGGYSDHPSDPGGATNMGITRAVLESWRGHPVTKADVRALTRDEAATIYAARYWAQVAGDDLPAGIDLAVFDCAVNQGVGRAVRLLQGAAYVVPDGVLGPVTMRAVTSANTRKLLTEFVARRMNAYGSLRDTFKTFGLGWSRRLIAVHAEALSMLDKSVVPDA